MFWTLFCNFTAEIKANYCWRKGQSIAAKVNKNGLFKDGLATAHNIKR
jgi:hypothetical protein